MTAKQAQHQHSLCNMGKRLGQQLPHHPALTDENRQGEDGSIAKLALPFRCIPPVVLHKICED